MIHEAKKKAPRSPYGDELPTTSLGGMKVLGIRGHVKHDYVSTPLPEPMSKERKKQLWIPNSDAWTLNQVDMS